MTKQPSLKELRMSDVVNQVVQDGLSETLENKNSCQAFREFLLTRSDHGVQHLDLFLNCEQFRLLEKNNPNRKELATEIKDMLFKTKKEDNFLLVSILKLENFKSLEKIDTQTETIDPQVFIPLQATLYKRLESEYFPRFVKKELRKTFFPGDESPLSESFSDLKISIKEHTSSELTNSGNQSSPKSEPVVSEDEIMGTFVAKAVDADIVNQILPEINQVEGWEANILALEKGEFIEGMKPSAFKKYVHTRARLPSIFIKPIKQ